MPVNLVYKDKRSGMIDSGSTSSNFAVVTLQMASGNTPFMSTESRKEPERIQHSTAFDKIGNDFAGDIAEIVAYDRAFYRVRQKLEGYLAQNGVLFLILPFHTHTDWQSCLEELRFSHSNLFRISR